MIQIVDDQGPSAAIAVKRRGLSLSCTKPRASTHKSIEKQPHFIGKIKLTQKIQRKPQQANRYSLTAAQTPTRKAATTPLAQQRQSMFASKVNSYEKVKVTPVLLHAPDTNHNQSSKCQTAPDLQNPKSVTPKTTKEIPASSDELFPKGKVQFQKNRLEQIVASRSVTMSRCCETESKPKHLQFTQEKWATRSSASVDQRSHSTDMLAVKAKPGGISKGLDQESETRTSKVSSSAAATQTPSKHSLRAPSKHEIIAGGWNATTSKYMKKKSWLQLSTHSTSHILKDEIYLAMTQQFQLERR